MIFVWTLGDIVMVALVGVAALICAAVGLKNWLRQRACQHTAGFNETSACDAICRRCGKNLGFIDNVRK